MDLAPHAESKTFFGSFNLMISRSYGMENTLPDTYGLKTDDLVDIMNEWRRRYRYSPSKKRGNKDSG
jgi:hypothetical protein